MGSFMAAAFSYPTAILSALLLVVVFYWLLALVGLVDFETSGIEIDTDAQLDGDAGDISVLASYILAMGLNGVPFSIVVSLLTLISWTLTCTAAEWLLPLLPGKLPGLLAGTLILLLSLALAIVLTARIVRPLRKLFVSHNAVSNASIVGQSCRILTGSVTEKFGRAEVATNGASINIRVWAATPNTLGKGASARILEYEADTGRYQVAAEP
ncbi:ubiquinone biosynthesis protein [Uliginosibacterium sp. TH139]|nr:ubiquinone biosynthesis protein [Uliginosibacterium sp. TH139]